MSMAKYDAMEMFLTTSYLVPTHFTCKIPVFLEDGSETEIKFFFTVADPGVMTGGFILLLITYGIFPLCNCNIVRSNDKQQKAEADLQVFFNLKSLIITFFYFTIKLMYGNIIRIFFNLEQTVLTPLA